MELRKSAYRVLLLFLCLLYINHVFCSECHSKENIVKTEDLVNCSKCAVQEDNTIKCYLYGLAGVKGYYGEPKVAMNISVYLEVLNEKICPENAINYLGRNTTDILWLLNIKAISTKKVDYFVEVQYDTTFYYPSNYLPFLENLSTLFFYLNVNYKETIIDGYIPLSPDCDPIRLNTTECFTFDTFDGLFMKNLQPKAIVSQDEEISLKNLLLSDRTPSIQSLTFTPEDRLTEQLSPIRTFLGDVEDLRISANKNAISLSEILPLNYPHMKNLELEYMIFKKIPRDFFKKVSNLEKLTLLITSINQVTSDFGILTNLRELKIRFQEITATQFIGNVQALEKMKFLTYLEISHINNFKTINRTFFPRLLNLKTLHLNGNYLENIPEDTFKNLPSLETLRLDQNKILSLFPNTFRHLKKLTQLELGYNQNIVVHGLKFSSTKINSLSLAGCKISNVDGIIQNGVIENLNLERNIISSWKSKSAFKGENLKIHNLNLGDNKIEAINEVMGESLNVLDSVNIDENPFNCQSCSLKEFQKWLINNNSKIKSDRVKIKHNDYLKCQLPLSLQGQLLINATYNTTLCKEFNYFTEVGIRFTAVFSATFIIVIIIYVYRFDILHIRHIWSMKKSSNQQELAVLFEFDVFVSYSSEDNSWVSEVLIPTLEEPSEAAHKYRLCLHDRDFPAGSYIVDNIVSCIEKSRRVIFVLSPSFIQSQWCQWELRLAEQRIFEESSRDSLVLLELERLSREALPINLRLLMSSRTCLEWPATPADKRAIAGFWERLRTALGAPLKVELNMEGVQDQVPGGDDESVE